jgi:hypothetical protein
MAAMLRTFTLAGLVLLLAGLLPAADVTGTWKGSFDYNGNAVPVTFQMKSAEGAITGTVDGLPTPNAEIKEGKLDGDTVSFWISIDYQGSPLKILLKGKVAGDEIKFTMGTEGGEWSTDLTAKKS